MLTMESKPYAYPYAVGWYGIPGAPISRRTMVHMIRTGDGPICGAKPGPEMEFQWCAYSKTAMETHGYVECRSCLRLGPYEVVRSCDENTEKARLAVAWQRKKRKRLIAERKKIRERMGMSS